MKVTKIGNLSAAADTFLQGLEPKKLYASSFDSDSPEEVNMVMANFSEPFSENDHNAIKETLNNEKAIFYFENVKAEDFPEGALFSTDADLCVIYSEAGGRVQHILMSGNNINMQIPEREGQAEIFESVIEQKEAGQDTTESNISAGMDETPSEINTDEVEPKTDIEIALDWLTGLSPTPRKNMLMGASDPQMKNINGSMAVGSVVAYQSYDTDRCGKKKTASLMASFNVELVADSTNLCKMLKITSNSSQVNPGGMTYNDSDGRGDATFEGTVIIYPGKEYIYDSRGSYQMPRGWSMDQHVPLTKNGTNEYVYTTGWKIGGDVAPDPKAPVKLSVSYDSSTQQKVSFLDFELQDLNVNGYCYWRYYFTTADRNWKDLFDFWGKVNSFPDLATSAMVMKNEVTYRIPKDETSMQMFCFNIGHRTIYAESTLFTIKYRTSGWIGNLWGYFSINMGSVKFPGNV